MFLLMRIKDGRFVAKIGNISSYTTDIWKVRIFSTREAAERNRCVENEIIVPLEELMKGGKKA